MGPLVGHRSVQADRVFYIDQQRDRHVPRKSLGPQRTLPVLQGYLADRTAVQLVLALVVTWAELASSLRSTEGYYKSYVVK